MHQDANIMTKFTKKELQKYKIEFLDEFTESIDFKTMPEENAKFLARVCFMYLSQCIHYKRELSDWGISTFTDCYHLFIAKLVEINRRRFFND